MISKSDHLRLRNLLADAISLLCRNGVPFRAVQRIDALIGITLDDNEVILINVNETQPSATNNESNPISDSTKKSTDCCSMGPESRESSLPCHQNQPETGKVGDSNGKRLMAEGTYTVSQSVQEKASDFGDLGNTCAESLSERLQQTGKLTQSCVEHTESGKMLLNCKSTAALSNSDVSNDDSCIYIKIEQIEQTNSNTIEVKQSSFETNYANIDSLVTGDSALQEQSYPMQPLVWPTVSEQSASSWTKRQATHANPKVSVTSLAVPYRKPSLRQTADLGPANQGTSERYGCHMCGAGLCSPQALRDHIRGTHFSLHSYVCVDCGLTFKWRSTLRSHRFSCPMSTHHSASS